MIVGEIKEETKELSLEFFSMDEKEFLEIPLEISSTFSSEELIETINNMEIPEEKYIKIILVRK